jgi:hypothetical protein
MTCAWRTWSGRSAATSTASAAATERHDHGTLPARRSSPVGLHVWISPRQRNALLRLIIAVQFAEQQVDFQV